MVAKICFGPLFPNIGSVPQPKPYHVFREPAGQASGASLACDPCSKGHRARQTILNHEQCNKSSIYESLRSVYNIYKLKDARFSALFYNV